MFGLANFNGWDHICSVAVFKWCNASENEGVWVNFITRLNGHLDSFGGQLLGEVSEFDLLEGPLVGSEGVGGDGLGSVEEVVLMNVLKNLRGDEVGVCRPERQTAINTSSIQLGAGGTVDDEVALGEVSSAGLT